MALPEFDYVLAKSRQEAAELNAQDDVRVMAGGTDVILLVQAKAFKGLKRVVDLKGIQGMDKLEFVPGEGLRIGALTKLYAIQNSPAVKENIPAVADAAHYVASAQIRRKGTMAGNIVNASPSADTVPILLAMNAVLQTYDKDGNTRSINMNDFYKGFRKYDLDKSRGEIVTDIDIPELKPGEGSAYLKHSVRKAMDLAIIGVAAWVKMDGRKVADARIALGGVAVNAIRAPKAEQMLIGHEITDELLEAVGLQASQECSPIDDVRASAEYRTDMVRVYTKRAIRKAAESVRAGEE